jgi:hypothetical protein
MGYIMNLQQRSDFYALLFEMWCASRLSKKIRNGLELCVEKLVSTIEKLLDGGRENGIRKFNPEECKEKARALLALPEGIAYHLLVNPDPVNLEDKKFWFQIRSMMLTILKKKIFT